MPTNYQGIVGDFWRERFAATPNGTRILDLAAGNGALAMLAAEASMAQEKEFSITASDLAEINVSLIGKPEETKLREHIEFVGNAPCEKQPFEDNSFDLICSQFGFEYSDVGATLAEVKRLLKKSGEFVAISHHVDSPLIEFSQLELDIYTMAIDELDLFERLGKYSRRLGDLHKTPERVQNAVEHAKPQADKLRDGLEALRQKYSGNPRADKLLSTLTYIAASANTYSMSQRAAVIEEASRDYTANKSRLEDMLKAALDQERVDAISEIAHDAGFANCSCSEMMDEEGRAAGWHIQLR